MTDDPPVSDLTVRDVLSAAAEGLDGVRVDADGDEIRWVAGETTFATLRDRVAEFRLDPLVAGAALRTPDAAPSLRGPDWVAFAPDPLDDGAVDRAEAWFLSAHRRASSGKAAGG